MGFFLFKDPFRRGLNETNCLHQKCISALVSSPNHQRWYAKWKLSRNTYTLHTRFCTFGADLYAQSVLSNKISASELSRKFIESALLVGVELLRYASAATPHSTHSFIHPNLHPLPSTTTHTHTSLISPRLLNRRKSLSI